MVMMLSSCIERSQGRAGTAFGAWKKLLTNTVHSSILSHPQSDLDEGK
jgi:hypothetical protein